ncbi:MAG TPA: DNA recombination protein RmuC [Solirubrobacteraceae bacterium]|nr:DNA recombination protein RmuC [Solirubrobacteraceae bacterium]
MSVALLIAGLVVGALAGAAIAAALARSGSERIREQLDAISTDNRERMRDEMKSISADVLKQTGDSLAGRLADQRRAEEERGAAEMAKRAEELKGLVGPVNEKLGRVEHEIGRLERERKQAQGELATMVRQLHEGVGGLRQETGNLVSALKRPNTRGSWGEIQLRNVIEMAGMIEHCDFLEQSTVQSEDGALRPDVLVKLPGEKLIVVDSKVPLDAYLAHLEAQTDDERALQMGRHARQTRDHITKLASKGYQRQFDTTPDLVVMFVPSEGIYHAALAEDPGLIEYGVHQQVLMATPTTLIGLLRAVHYGWRQELIAESAREIAESARELHRRIARFVDPLAKVGRALGSAVGSYNEAVGSFDSRVLPQLRRIEESGAKSERELTSPAPVEVTPRPLSSGSRPLEDLPDGEPILKRITSAAATGTVAGSSSTAKNNRSNEIASSATSSAPQD